MDLSNNINKNIYKLSCTVLQFLNLCKTYSKCSVRVSAVCKMLFIKTYYKNWKLIFVCWSSYLLTIYTVILQCCLFFGVRRFTSHKNSYSAIVIRMWVINTVYLTDIGRIDCFECRMYNNRKFVKKKLQIFYCFGTVDFVCALHYI